MKHWTEPNGIFIINFPIEWQYKNNVIENVPNESPYSFELYEEPIGCFQLSCYPLSDKRLNPHLPLQRSNSQIEWAPSRVDDEKFNVHLFGAQVDDQLCFAKYIYSKVDQNNPALKKELQKVIASLKTFRLIPEEDRKHASDLNKYDNFIGSLGASYDLLYKAIELESFVEIVVISSNQIDAFLRLSIILHNQISNESKGIETKYLYQGDDEKGVFERKIYTEACKLGIIDTSLYEELNHLYDLRNRVIHRYIISNLKTRDIVRIAQKYLELNEKVRLVLKELEQQQSEMGLWIYGLNPKGIENIDADDRRWAYAFANDKHLYDNLKRKL